MKKVSLIITAVALTIGVSQAFAGKVAHKVSKFATIYRYTIANAAVYTGTRTTAQEDGPCVAGAFHCANAWTTSGTLQHVPAFDLTKNTH